MFILQQDEGSFWELLLTVVAGYSSYCSAFNIETLACKLAIGQIAVGQIAIGQYVLASEKTAVRNVEAQKIVEVQTIDDLVEQIATLVGSPVLAHPESSGLPWRFGLCQCMRLDRAQT